MDTRVTLLENNFMAYIRTSSLFFIAGIALFNFTNLGKNFSVISLIIGLILIIAIVVDFFVERHKISQLGLFPRTIIDLLAFTLIAVIFLMIWILLSVWQTTPISLSSLSKTLQEKLKTNKEILNLIGKNLQETDLDSLTLASIEQEAPLLKAFLAYAT